jgi:hypothetical protein
MRRPFSRLAAACAFAVAMTAFTGSAFAGNGQGNDTAPGQLKQDQAAAAQPAVATQAPEASTAQPKSGQDHSPGQVKKQQQSSAASTQSSSSQQSAAQTGPGVKPNSNTTHWTHCVAGGTPGATTCTSSDNGHTPQPNADASKRYGNGTTAAQIVVSRGGGSSNVELTGPGNSQPHKVHVCGKPNNPSGGVDVHAVKNYSAAGCTETTTPAAAPVAPCGFVVVATTSETGTSHGHGKGLSHNKHEKSTTSFSVQADSTQSCNSAAVAPATQQAAVAPATPAASPVTQASPATQSVGAVLGVQKTLTSPKPARGGVLGTVTNVAGSSLPFTGFPIWLAVLLAVALILAGLALRRRGSVTSV